MTEVEQGPYAHPVLGEQTGGVESQYPASPDGLRGDRMDVP